jgi:hypothetical protein
MYRTSSSFGLRFIRTLYNKGNDGALTYNACSISADTIHTWEESMQ